MIGCGCERAGILVMNNGAWEIERCDECQMFDSDDDAAEAVSGLLKLLHRVHVADGRTVADAFDVIETFTKKLEEDKS